MSQCQIIACQNTTRHLIIRGTVSKRAEGFLQGVITQPTDTVRGFMDKTLLKGLQVLTSVTTAERSVRITDIADELGFTKSNAYRLLKTLEVAGFIQQNAVSKEFSPSLKLWELGMKAVGRLNLRDIAHQPILQLAELSRETVHLAVLDDLEVIYIEKIDSPEPIGAYTQLGGRAPACCVATGKALLSQMPDEVLAEKFVSLTAYSKNTITDRDQLIAELQQARAQGFALNRGEWRESVWGMASAITDTTGKFRAAVGVSGPQFRFEGEERRSELAAMVMKTAREISIKLGSSV